MKTKWAFPAGYYEYPQAVGEDFDSDSDGSIEVIALEDEAEWSGLFDKNGSKLYRPKQRIGFLS